MGRIAKQGAAILGVVALCAYALANCTALDTSPGRTRDSAEAAADLALQRHPEAAFVGRDDLADGAVGACTEIDEAMTDTALDAGVGCDDQVTMVVILTTLVQEHCPEHLEAWRD